MIGGFVVAFVIVVFSIELLRRSNTANVSRFERVVFAIGILCAALEAAFETTATTRLLKQNVGFLRPDFTSICFGTAGRQNSSSTECTTGVRKVEC